MQTGHGHQPVHFYFFLPLANQLAYVSALQFSNRAILERQLRHEQGCTSAPPLCLHGVDKDNVTFVETLAGKR
jgi:hypothetical protein